MFGRKRTIQESSSEWKTVLESQVPEASYEERLTAILGAIGRICKVDAGFLYFLDVGRMVNDLFGFCFLWLRKDCFKKVKTIPGARIEIK